MAVLHSPESAYAKEVWKWDHTVLETNPLDGAKGMRPATFQKYPRRLYTVTRASTGGRIDIIDSEEVISEEQEHNLRSRGFIALDEAAEHVSAQEQELAELAANRAYQERRMSPAAQAEAAAVDAATSRHLAEIPALPIKPTPKRSYVRKKGTSDAE